MEVTLLELFDFRNYEHAEVALASGLNLIEGRNGQGKTNLLEAVHVLSGFGSHRTSSLSALVRHGTERAVIRSKGRVRNREVAVDAEIRAGAGMRVLVNKTPLGKGPSPLVATVLFSPEDLSLIKGGPDERRRYLDHAAAKLRPMAAAERQEFERALKQRNGVLKAASINPRAQGHLEVWTERVVSSGACVVRNRLQALERLAGPVQSQYAHVSGVAGPVDLQYEASWSEQPSLDNIEQELQEAMEASQTRDIERGATNVGPHRDDLRITLSSSDARLYASQGEQRSLALALRLAERRVISEERGEDPVLLLDDVFSELDEQRRARLGELVHPSGQTIATATAAAELPLDAVNTIRVEAGKVVGR